jgi:hypothetical protein
MSVTFRTEIEWPDNQLLLPAEYYNITTPSGLSSFQVRAPNFVDVNRMGQLGHSNVGSSSTGQLSIVNGRVTKDLRVEFANPVAQWRRTSQGARGPGQYQFTGGETILKLRLGIWILDLNNPAPDDDLAVQIFALIYGHELLHVVDEIDIVRNWLPTRITNETAINQYLVRAQTYTYGTPRQAIQDVDREFREHIRSRIQQEILHVWAPETNRRGGLRDAPAQYAIVQSQVDTLRARQINRPRRQSTGQP